MVRGLSSPLRPGLDWEWEFAGEVKRFQSRWDLQALIIRLVPSLLSVFGIMYGFRAIATFMLHFQFPSLKINSRESYNSPVIDGN